MKNLLDKIGTRKALLICRIMVAVAVLAFWFGMIRSDVAQYTPEKLQIEVVDVRTKFEGETYGDDYYGTHYIYLDYQITNRSGGELDYITTKTTVKRKSGEQIMTIDSSFNGMKLAKGDNKVMTNYLSETGSWMSDEFAALYEADVKDLDFTVEIQSIRWTNNKSYYNHN